MTNPSYERAPVSSSHAVTIRAPASALARVGAALSLIFCEGASMGLATWEFAIGPPLDPYVASNALAPSLRRYVFINMACGALIALASALVLFAWRRTIATLESLGRKAAPFLLAGLLPLLLRWQLWVGRDLVFLVLVSLFALTLPPLLKISLTAGPLFAERLPRAPAWMAGVLRMVRSGWIARVTRNVRESRRAPLAIACAAALGYAIYFSAITIQNHYRLGTAAFDLGLESNLLWNAVHGGPLFKSSPLGGPMARHGGYHQTYIAYLLGLPYLLIPRPETLLVIQAVVMGGAAVPLYLLARRRLTAWSACLIAVLFTLYPPLHGANLYDFHYLPFAPLLLWTTLLLVEGRRYVWAAVLVVLTLSTREDLSALLVVMGLYLIVVDERPKAGLVVAAVGALYFVVVKMIIMPRLLNGHPSFIHQYAGLLPEGDSGYGGVIKTVIGNPAFTLGGLLQEDKLVYVLQIAAPLAFIPWRAPIGFLCSLPGFFFTLLATGYPPLIQTSFQYTAYWISFLFPAIILNTASAPAAVRKAWIATLAVAVLVTSHQYGAVLQTHTIRGGFGPFRFGITDDDRKNHADLYGLIAQIPPRAKVVSGEMIVAHVSNRPDSYTLRTGVYDAEYMLFTVPPRSDEAPFVLSALRSGEFGIVDLRGQFALAKRGSATDRN
ncbi:MAG: DUF2079 domain-containing protein, partial [Myxococcota bacterium]|nr:DUF2079 domain-containing protein [Myxococcota bacterium]